MSAATGPMYGAIARLATLAEARKEQYAELASEAKTERSRRNLIARVGYYERIRLHLADAMFIASRGVQP